MVFESVIANLLNAYLGHFIDDVNASQLQLGAWKGNVELKNLAIKEDAFDSLDLPFKIVHGHVGKLTAVIPWSSLYSSPVILSLDDVFVVALPNVLEEYDEDVEKERAWLAKKKKLDLIEATKRSVEAKAGEFGTRKNLNELTQEDDGFVTKLAAQVIRNVQIHLTNIHIVYEDKFTDSLNPFQVGLTLNRIVFQTVADANWQDQQTKYTDAQKKELIFKVSEIDYLSLYFNSEGSINFLSEIVDGDEIDSVLRNRIARPDLPEDSKMDYILKPVTFKGHFVINSKPEKFEFTIPVADVDMLLGDFIVHLKRSQLHSITSFMDSVNRIRTASAYRKWRPRIAVHKNTNEWWQFAMSAVLERDIKPRRNNWNWKRMKKHRQKCREYKELYKEKLLCQKTSDKVVIEAELEEYERQLDVFNIVLCRSQAEIECKPELQKRREEQAAKKSGWLGGWGVGGLVGWYGSSAKTEEKTEAIVSDLKREMTQEQKEKLYRAIGYDSSSVGVLDTPKDFVGFIVNFRLDSIKAVITGFDQNFRIGEFCMSGIGFLVRYRPAANAVHFETTIDSISMMTSSEDPNLKGKSASMDSRRRAIMFARSMSEANEDSPVIDFGLHLNTQRFKLETDYESSAENSEGASMTVTSGVEEIQLTMTNFTTYTNRAPTESQYYILRPCGIQLIFSQDGTNQTAHVQFSELDVHMSPQALKILTKVLGAFSGTSEVKPIERKPPRASEVFIARLLSRDSKFRASVIENAIEVTEDMNMALQAAARAIGPSAAFDTSSNAKRDIYLDMRDINFVVEAGITTPQPLIKFHSSIFGQLQNSDFVKFECQCLLNYYNEQHRAWEPMIEPVSYEPYPSGEPVLWKFDATLKMRTSPEGQTLMDIDLESGEQLDITISRTAVNVLLSLLDALSDENTTERSDIIRNVTPRNQATKRKCIRIRNLLPLCVKYNVVGSDEIRELGAGDEGDLDDIELGRTHVRMKLLDYLGYTWTANRTIEGETEDEEFDTWKFYPLAYTSNKMPAQGSLAAPAHHHGHKRTDSSDDTALVLLMTTTKDPKSGQLISSLFAPYWMVNRTHLPINWRFSGRKGQHVHDPGDLDYPVLMSFRQTLFAKKRVQIQMNDSEFSDGFPIDVVGSKGTVLVKGKDNVFYTVAVHINISRIALTKIITVHPFYLITNKTKSIIEFSEDNDEFKTAIAKNVTPFWPYRTKDLTLCFRLQSGQPRGTLRTITEIVEPTIDECSSSRPVSLVQSNATLLNLSDDQLVYVTVDVEESGVQITLEDYFEGCSALLLVNGTDDLIIRYGQEGCKPRHELKHMQSVHYTWQNPLGSRMLNWSINNGPETTLNPRQDDIKYNAESDTCWVSFIDGAQRVFLITHDFTLASSMLKAVEMVQPQIDITMTFRGLGLSLVDDFAGKEIAYFGIAPSGLIWERKPPGRRHYQAISLRDMEVIEAAYIKQVSKYRSATKASSSKSTSAPSTSSPLRSSASSSAKALAAQSSSGSTSPKNITKLDRKIKIEWPSDPELLEYPTQLEPEAGHLRRVKNRGIWCYIGWSEHTTQVHLKVSHMQIDNQMPDSLFSAIMSHIPAPRSVVGEKEPKPFVEFSAVVQRQANLQRFKYLSLLIQEFFIKIELPLLMSLMEFSNEASTWYYRNYTHKEMIETDLDTILNSHLELVESTTRSARVLYDLIHFSPIKLNVSFSMSSASDHDAGSSSLPLGLDFILRSAGVTLTEFQDVTFRLDCFERNTVFFTQNQLMWASLDHYKRQILKQFYAIVLGLDVIGNPVCLVMDLRQGVGDFFYEPIQGIIKGPEEAVEGLAIGVASLFSHTFGGAIGALSKISGTLGEGISSLTFDDELKRRRRQRRRQQPNIARSAKDLVEGFVGGITGLVTRPVSGAKQDGFEGFAKGIGKGVIGVFTRPATSVVDFATGTLNAIKVCVHDQHVIKRLRPPRYIVLGEPLRPYNRHEAEQHQRKEQK